MNGANVGNDVDVCNGRCFVIVSLIKATNEINEGELKMWLIHHRFGRLLEWSFFTDWGGADERTWFTLIEAALVVDVDITSLLVSTSQS